MLEKNPEDQGLLLAALQADQLELGAIDDHLAMPELPKMESNPRGVVDYYRKLISLVLSDLDCRNSTQRVFATIARNTL